MKKGETVQFSFGGKRHGARSARRLFVPQKYVIETVFTPEAERPRAILRVVSGG